MWVQKKKLGWTKGVMDALGGRKSGLEKKPSGWAK